MKRAISFVLLSAASVFAADLPQPRVVDPGGPGQAPSDALVLFDGRDLSAWVHTDGTPAKWAVEDGNIVCKTGSGNILTERTFGSMQMHIEFSTPSQPDAEGQGKGNSGVYIQGRYELQVLDSFNNPTYPDGAAGAIYKQSAPAVNVSRPPGQWQSYDIVFHAAECASGEVTKPGMITVLHNGVLIQDNFELRGPTPGGLGGDVCEAGPILLQDHIHRDVKETALRFRNIWVRPM